MIPAAVAAPCWEPTSCAAAPEINESGPYVKTPMSDTPRALPLYPCPPSVGWSRQATLSPHNMIAPTGNRRDWKSLSEA